MLRLCFKIFIQLLFIGVCSTIGLIWFYGRDLPNALELKQYTPPCVTRIYTIDGKLIEQYAKENRVFTPIEAIPKTLKQAFIAVEDKNFYEHNGIDFTGILRACVNNVSAILHGNRMQGGSTITQQVVKNFLLSSTRSIERKIKEAILAFQISRIYSKEKVLELYLNQIYLGKGAYGIASAAQVYFNKSVDELNIQESALLAAMPKAPALFDPTRHYDRAKQRRDYVLKRMVQEGYIHESTASNAIKTPINLKRRDKTNTVKANYVADLVRNQVINMYGERFFYTQGLTIITSIKSDYQEHAQKSLIHALNLYNTKHNKIYKKSNTLESGPDGGILVMNYNTGQIFAMAGGKNYDTSKFNRVIHAKRQPGSAIKALVYLAALENGVEPNTIFTDEPVSVYQGPNLPLWTPRNYERNFLGDITMRYAFEKSRNIISVKIAQKLGIEKIQDIMLRFGVNDNIDPFFSIILGSVETTLLRMTNAYATIANFGHSTQPTIIELIKNSRGQIIHRRNNQVCYNCGNINKIPEIKDKKTYQVTDEASAYQITSMMEGATHRGTSKGAKKHIKQIFAGKTGTTNKSIDTWYVGFSSVPQIVVGTYIGYDNPKTLGKHANGATTALPAFTHFMQYATKDMPKVPFLVPEDIKVVKTYQDTGEIVNIYKKRPGVLTITDALKINRVKNFKYNKNTQKTRENSLDVYDIINYDITTKGDVNTNDTDLMYLDPFDHKLPPQNETINSQEDNWNDFEQGTY